MGFSQANPKQTRHRHGRRDHDFGHQLSGPLLRQSLLGWSSVERWAVERIMRRVAHGRCGVRVFRRDSSDETETSTGNPSYSNPSYCSIASRGAVRTLLVYTERLVCIYLPTKGGRVPKRLIDLDDELLAAAQGELGTTGVSDTVRIALQQAAARSARARQIEWLEQGGLEGMANPEERGEVWR
jgi:Arc/MetJ family transcription regulator